MAAKRHKRHKNIKLHRGLVEKLSDLCVGAAFQYKLYAFTILLRFKPFCAFCDFLRLILFSPASGEKQHDFGENRRFYCQAQKDINLDG